MPRQRNLIQNPSFESGLLNWTSTNVVASDTANSHSGLLSAQMGAGGNNALAATLFQDVPVLPWRYYVLVFSVAGNWDAPADMQVTVDWLDSAGAVIGSGLSFSIQQFAIGNASVGEWNTYVMETSQAPWAARGGRILFTKAPNPADPNNFVAVDDVTFTE